MAWAIVTTLGQQADSPNELNKKGIEACDAGRYGEAFTFFQQAAEQGYAPAQANLALAYLMGRGVATDTLTAFSWYEKALPEGNDQTTAAYGKNIVMYSRSTASDVERGMRLLKKTADNGYTEAKEVFIDLCMVVGYRYISGRYGTADYASAGRWYMEGAKAGDVDCQYSVGELHEQGRGLPKDINAARFWYEQAAAQGDEDAKVAVARLDGKQEEHSSQSVPQTTVAATPVTPTKPTPRIEGTPGKYRLMLDDKPLIRKFYQQLRFDNQSGMFIGQFGDYATYITLDGQELTPIAKQIFDKAYAMSDSYATEKLELYMLMLESDPADTEGYHTYAYNNMGALYDALERTADAKTCYEQSLRIDSSNTTARNNLNAIHRKERLSNVSNTLGQIGQAIGNMGGQGSYGQEYSNGNTYNGNNSNQGANNGTGTRRMRNCTHCAGTGDCNKCHGRGHILGRIDQEYRCCPICNSNCSAPKSKVGKCMWCGGTGKR